MFNNYFIYLDVSYDFTISLYFFQRTKLHSIASKDGEVENKNDYLSNYPTLRSFNEALVQIGNECADTRNIKFDIISRATSAEGLLQMLEANGDAPYQPSM